MRLRSVELELAEIAPAADFLEHVWGLVPAGTAGGTRYFRGTGDHPYILSLTQAAAPAVVAITFSGSPEEIDTVRKRAGVSGTTAFDVPGGGSGFDVRGPEGQPYR